MMQWIHDDCAPSELVPVLEIHGTQDSVTWWDGDPMNIGGWGAYLGVTDTFDFWKQLNGCVESAPELLPNIDPGDGSTVEVTRCGGGAANNDIWLYSVVDGGHDWPGAWGNMDINASEEIWKFFELALEG